MKKGDIALIAFAVFVAFIALWIVMTAFPYLGPFT
jgi:hypothetical protein